MEKINKQVPFVVDDALLRKMDEFIESYGHVYTSRSHFLRCSAIFLMFSATISHLPFTPAISSPKEAQQASKEMERGDLPPQLRKPKASETFGSRNDGLSYLAKGGRAGLKGGGSARGCGKALRGFGKAMKGKR